MAAKNNAKERTDSLQYISNLEEDLKLSAEIGAALLSENEELKQQTLELWTELDEARAAYNSLQRRNEVAAGQLKKADTTIAELSQRVQDLKNDNLQARQKVRLSEEAHSATKTKFMGTPNANENSSAAVTPRGSMDHYSRYQSPTKAAHNKAREKIAELSDELTELRTELMATKESALERRKSRKLASAQRQSEEDRAAMEKEAQFRNLEAQLAAEREAIKALNLEVGDLENSYVSQQQLVDRQSAQIEKLDNANQRLESKKQLDEEFGRQEAERAREAHERQVKAIAEKHEEKLRQQEG